MSPELCSNQPYGMQSDVWALGCILYEMCVLKHAFDATNICGLIFKILNGTFPPISDQYSEEIRDLVSKMLSREPKERPTLVQILKMPLITRAMKLLEQDLKQGVQLKTPKTPSKQRKPPGPGPAAAPSQSPTRKSQKQMLQDRKRKKQEDEDKRVLQMHQRASLDNLKNRMATKELKQKQLNGTLTSTPELPPANQTNVTPPPASAPEPSSSGWEVQPGATPPGEQIEGEQEGWQVQPEAAQRGGSLAGNTVSSDDMPQSGSMGRTGSSMEEELPEALPIIDGHTLPRNEEGAQMIADSQHIEQPADEEEEEEEDYASDFEAYSSDFESDDEKVMENLTKAEENQLEQPAVEEPPSPAATARHDQYYLTKILPLRQKCEAALGVEKFEQVHAILRRRWSGECADESEIKRSLEAIVTPANMNAVFLVDQLIFCEEHQT